MNQQPLFNATVKLTKNKLIEQVMSPQDLKDTGVGDLTKEQKAALNAFLDSNLGLAPVGGGHGGGTPVLGPG